VIKLVIIWEIVNEAKAKSREKLVS
jgi:hypothetical protein